MSSLEIEMVITVLSEMVYFIIVECTSNKNKDSAHIGWKLLTFVKFVNWLQCLVWLISIVFWLRLFIHRNSFNYMLLFLKFLSHCWLQGEKTITYFLFFYIKNITIIRTDIVLKCNSEYFKIISEYYWIIIINWSS